MRQKVFKVEMFGARVHLLWDATHDQFKRYVRAKYDRDYDGDDDFLGRCIMVGKNDPPTAVLMLPKWKGTAYDISILVHECLHAVEGVLRHYDVSISEDTEEVRAYFLDWLVLRCLGALL